MQPIYLDNQSTTPIDPAVLDYMQSIERTVYGNAASKTHDTGRVALETVEKARQQVAALVDCDPSEITFTSGATEAINLALKGIWLLNRPSRPRYVTFATEHNAVLDTCRWLASQGASTTVLPVTPSGLIRPEELTPFSGLPDLILSVAHGNNEIGTIHPVEHIKENVSCILHVDASQTLGKCPVSIRKSNIDLLSVSSHKLYGPKGVGALIKRRQQPPVRLEPLIHGGGHERGLRSGTLNVPGIAGFGLACEIAAVRMAKDAIQTAYLRDLLLTLLRQLAAPILVNGSMKNRLPGNLNVSFPDLDGPQLLPRLRHRLAVSSGSACSSANPTPSHVLRAIGCSDTLAAASLRFGIGRFTTETEIRECAEVVAQAVASLRAEYRP